MRLLRSQKIFKAIKSFPVTQGWSFQQNIICENWILLKISESPHLSILMRQEKWNVRMIIPLSPKYFLSLEVFYLDVLELRKKWTWKENALNMKLQ